LNFVSFFSFQLFYCRNGQQAASLLPADNVWTDRWHPSKTWSSNSILRMPIKRSYMTNCDPLHVKSYSHTQPVYCATLRTDQKLSRSCFKKNLKKIGRSDLSLKGINPNLPYPHLDWTIVKPHTRTVYAIDGKPLKLKAQ